MPQPPNTSQIHSGTLVSIILKADQRTGRQVQGAVADVLTRGNHPRGIKVRLRDGRIGRVQGLVVSSSATVTPPSSSSSFASSGGTTAGAAAGSAAPGGVAGLAAGGKAVASTAEEQEIIRRDLEIQNRVRGPDRRQRGGGGGGGGSDTFGTFAGTSTTGTSTTGGSSTARLSTRYTDHRLDSATTEPPPPNFDLLAFAKPARSKKGGKKKKNPTTNTNTNTENTDAVVGDHVGIADGRTDGAGGGDGGDEEGGTGTWDCGSGRASASVTVMCPVCGGFEGDEVAVARHVGEHFS